MTVILHPLAIAELKDSAKWYNDQEEFLGDELINEVSQTLKELPVFPEMWPEVYSDIRRCHTGRFPFSILYQIFPEHIFVYAIMHDSRKPGYWLNRVED